MARAGVLRPLAEFTRDYAAAYGDPVPLLRQRLKTLFGIDVHETSIARLLTGDTYAEEPGPVQKRRPVSGGHVRGQQLTPQRVRELRKEYFEKNTPVAELSRRFSRSIGYIRQIARGFAWSAVPLPRNATRQRVQTHQGLAGARNPNAKLTAADVHRMRQAYWRDKRRPAELAVEFRTSKDNVWMICNNWRWRLPAEEFARLYAGQGGGRG